VSSPAQTTPINHTPVISLVTQYSPGVGAFPEVKFAVSISLALDSNNYVKFFKLIRYVLFNTQSHNNRKHGLNSPINSNRATY